ncbi:MAG: TonB-dependent receptor plug domain-containing protein [Janthinobacterium lividum]
MRLFGKEKMRLPGRRSLRWALPAAALLGLMAFRQPADENPVRVLAERLAAFYNRARLEKVYLHLDRPVYGTGETIWFNAYLVDGLRHRPDSLSRIVYVELLSPQRRLITRRTLRVEDIGLAHGDIELGDTLQGGTYVLRAYTNWMRNAGPNYFYQRQLQVWPASPEQPADKPAPIIAARPSAQKTVAAKVDVQLFPEGGTLVAGLPSVVAFKAQAVTGRGLAISGQVLDGQNKPVGAAFKSQHLGMGHFSFTPVAGQQYHARVTLPGGGTADYPLPAAQPSGYALHVVDSGENFDIEARYLGATPPGPALLLSEVRGYIVGLPPRPLTSDGKPATWRVAKSKYPNGIVHFTLFDAQSRPQAERLAFVQNAAPVLRIALTADKAAYAPHDRVLMKAKVMDASGQPVTTRFSVAVAEQGAANLDANAETIASNLLLTSDLTGYVEEPGYYFKNQTPEVTQALDDLLLTQGWRRFVWKDLLAGTLPLPQYRPEQALALSGVVTGMGHNPIANSQLTYVQTKPTRQVLTATTDGQGRFSFVGFDGKDTAVVTLQARRTGGGSNVTVRPDLGAPTFGGQPLPGLPSIAAAPAGVADYVRRSRQQRVTERMSMPDDGLRNVQLADVAVTAQREKNVIPANDPRRLIPGAVANTVLDFTKMPEAQSGIPIFTLLQGRVAGLAISGNPPNQTIQIRNSGTPQIVLDGVRVDADAINNINSVDVEAVEVFKGNEAAIFGASGGVIAIYTKRGNRNYKGPPTGPGSEPTGLITVKLPGYYEAREFYRPRYGAPVLNASESDPRRLTIYWNPSLQTDSKGEAEFTFFTADGSGNYQATAEGLTLTGEPGRGTGTIYVAPKR